MRVKVGKILVAAVWLAIVTSGQSASVADDSPSPDRGRVALTAHSYIEPSWSLSAYEKAGGVWGEPAPDPKAEPEAYAATFNRRYGLNPAPYPNDGLPMGLRRATTFDGKSTGIAIDCMVCHGGSIGGTSYVGLGNTQIDLERLLPEMTLADGGRKPFTGFLLNTSRGTVAAGQISVLLLSLRNGDLSRRRFPLLLNARIPEMDTPAWWHLKRKATQYYDGRTPAGSVRTNMQFMLGDLSAEQFREFEPAFADIQAYFKSLTPPKYPFAIDQTKAARGATLFAKSCARCHGTYGPDGEYPSKIIPLEIIGTDPERAKGLSDTFVAHYNSTWFAENHPVDETMTGYQAPPLDGLWATAPYLHNGSVPTVYHLLKSSERPARFRRPPSTDFAHYDKTRLGWTFEVVPGDPDPSPAPPDDRRLFDSSRWGLGNGGHTFGDKLTDDERMDVIEYLKTL